MTLQELYQQIRLQQAIVQRLNDLWPEFEMPEELLAGMMDRETAGQAYRKLDAVLAGDEDHMKMLFCQMECARRVGTHPRVPV